MLHVPHPEDYDVSSVNGFLPQEPPLQKLPDQYYEPWEYILENLQGLILTKRLREVVDRLPVLSTDRLVNEPQWRRAYCALAFMTHAYVWSGARPAERIPPPISIPFLAICKHLELPTVATYAGVCLWNWKPVFGAECAEQGPNLSNLDIIDTFTGAIDEKWFYLISIAIEAQGGPLIPLMLRAIEAAARGDAETVTQCLRTFAEGLDAIGETLKRMYDECDPHFFYHRLRPFLAGSKNMAAAGLPNGVVFDNGGPINKQKYVQYAGGSNAQSSLIQFFDVVLGVDHRPTGEGRPTDARRPSMPPTPGDDQARNLESQKNAGNKSNFIHEMRTYMPGKHARFLQHVADVTNLRFFVQLHRGNRELSLAFDACLAMLSNLRSTHIQMVSRYVVVQSRAGGGNNNKSASDRKTSEAGNGNGGEESGAATPPRKPSRINLAARRMSSMFGAEKRDLKGTGGSSLIPFLRQARDETSETAIESWTQTILRRGSVIDRRPSVAPDRLAPPDRHGSFMYDRRGSVIPDRHATLGVDRRGSYIIDRRGSYVAGRRDSVAAMMDKKPEDIEEEPAT